VERQIPIQYMKNHMGNNKALGLLAQAEFERWAHSNPSIRSKYFDGCWVASPKGFTATRRICFFVHRQIEHSDSVDTCIDSILSNRGFHALFGSISRSGLGVLYCIPTNGEGPSLDKLNWHLFRYQNETLNQIDPFSFFNSWPGSRGRPSRGRPWQDHVSERYEALEMDLLRPLVLNQVFYNSFVKGVFRKPVSDPYDTDAFIVSYEGKIFPLEIKEKFPFTSGRRKLFGIDAGRILMLLRMCLPLDCNGLYVIREVDEDDRRFLGWKMLSLDAIVMNSNWNLQAGGTGMLGGRTQTVTFPYEIFEDLTVDALSDDRLHEMSGFSEGIRRKASEFVEEVESLFAQSAGQSGGQTRLATR